MLTVDTILDQVEGLLQSRAFPYILAGVLIVIWWAVSAVVGVFRRTHLHNEDRPRRRLPLH
ncbi:MAG TPA: hypothetical protein QGF95_06130 [Candidatus Latescibacteria bacterium]|jgi:hypothetical protein|nr:hypothetical protein [Gemmatimonadaceae bacterium]MDP6018015.1 hypothetical protein [Candidatus Latescibacterota bacterium]HJP30114.1 hypothetical protein [Candidatus Latescibacterota bacterium]|tara:strand:- start:465 stop:647 length:183 start_codon:yes stop_codon:yes gene_type:complete